MSEYREIIRRLLATIKDDEPYDTVAIDDATAFLKLAPAVPPDPHEEGGDVKGRLAKRMELASKAQNSYIYQSHSAYPGYDYELDGRTLALIDRLEEQVRDLRANALRDAEGFLLAFGGVCPSGWVYDGTDHQRVAEQIRARGSELQSENARLAGLVEEWRK